MVFDLDDTLYAESSYFEAVFSAFCAEVGWPSTAYASLIANFPFLRRNQKDFFGYFLDHNHDLIGSSTAGAADRQRSIMHDRLFSLYKGLVTRLEPMPGANAWMKFAWLNDLKIGVLTNGVPAAQRNKWACLDISCKDRAVLLPARELGQEKPHSESFKAISRLLGIEMVHITFIGDRYDSDLAYPLSQGAGGILIGNCDENILVNAECVIAPDLESALAVVRLTYSMH